MGIVLMVFRHARAPYSDFVLLFHMAIFFIASGYLVKSDSIENMRSLVLYYWRKLKGLYFPYILYSALFICLNNVFIQFNIYTDNTAFMKDTAIEATYKTLFTSYSLSDVVIRICKAAVFRASTQIGGAFWFFQVLLLVLIAYATVGFVLNKILTDKRIYLVVHGLLSIGLLVIGYYCCLTGNRLHALDRVCSVYILIFIGNLFKESKIMNRLLDNNRIVFVSAISCIVLCLGYHRGYIALDGNHIENPAFFVLMSCSGWFCLYGIAVMLENHNSNVNKLLIYISRHSVAIIALHFLSFKIVSISAVCLLRMPKYMIAAFPVLMTDGIWWAFYLIIGIGVPLGIEIVFNCIKKIIYGGIRKVKCLT